MNMTMYERELVEKITSHIDGLRSTICQHLETASVYDMAMHPVIQGLLTDIDKPHYQLVQAVRNMRKHQMSYVAQELNQQLAAK